MTARPTVLRFSNGLNVLYLHTPQDPIAACHLFFSGGAASEPASSSGITMLMCSVINKGTQKRPARQLAEIESIGAYIGAGATQDYWELSCHSTSDVFPLALDLMAEILFEPAFTREEVDKEKAATLAAIRSKKESIFTVTNEILNTHLYGDHPYARPSTGTEKSVGTLNADQIRRWHTAQLRPERTVLSIASSIPLENLRQQLERLFGPSNWAMPRSEGEKHMPAPKSPQAPMEMKNPSRFEQAYLMIGFPAADIGSSEYMPMKVLNAILGGGMSARLFQSLREKQGLAYDVGSYYPSKRNGSAFIVHMGLQASQVEKARAGIQRELDLIQNEKVPEKELKQVLGHLKGSFILDHQTNSQRAHYIGWWHTLGLGAFFDQQYVPSISAVTVDQVFEMAKKTFSQPSVIVETLPTVATVQNATV